MEKTHPLAPTIKWAQRKEKVYMTVEIRDIKNEKIDLQPTSLSFLGESDEKLYEFKVEFFEEIDVEVSFHLTQASKWSKFGFHLQFILAKKNTDAKYWPRLIKDTKKQQNIHVDWDKYVD
jgi:prostaglandin-E synthase